ncbi:MBL fold metallo-hydrolase [Amycolatopsis sp. NBC_00438]|uniref:MBL fold metallo-hydrolase n=1 Tax=Amycolatopsis sp. NBC_00438 TaxID=2903558 RepID=UPI002E212823
MELVEITPRLHLIRDAFVQAYLWQDDDALTLIDTGLAGWAPGIADAIRSAGREPGELRRIVLTHYHSDHAGAAADIRAWGGIEVLAHHADAPVVRGERPATPPVLLDWERPLYEQTGAETKGLTGPPCAVDRELADGDELGFGGGAKILAIPGHTDGSIAIHLPEHGVLFTGDSVTQMEGAAMPGVFNTDRPRLLESFRRLAALNVEIACFGHMDPFTEHAGKRLRAALDGLA